MKTPVIFMIFNRPEQTKRVFEVIRAAKPEKLLIIADGARNAAEKEVCEKTRAIVENVDWPCEVLKKYSVENFGCRKNISAGLTWAFEQVERAIILEDDCLPDQSFFRFCEEMLEKFESDSRIMSISGNFFQQKNKRFGTHSGSYYFSILPHIWGWATWRRAWKLYDVEMKQWPKIRTSEILSNTLKKTFHNAAAYEYWETIWNQYYEEKIDSWDGQWAFACMSHAGLSVTPTKNLVKNIGFGPGALHTKNANSFFANLPLEKMEFPLIHPPHKKTPTANHVADSFTWKQNFGINAQLQQRILGPIRRTFPKTYSFFRNHTKKLLGK